MIWYVLAFIIIWHLGLRTDVKNFIFECVHPKAHADKIFFAWATKIQNEIDNDKKEEEEFYKKNPLLAEKQRLYEEKIEKDLIEKERLKEEERKMKEPERQKKIEEWVKNYNKNYNKITL